MPPFAYSTDNAYFASIFKQYNNMKHFLTLSILIFTLFQFKQGSTQCVTEMSQEDHARYLKHLEEYRKSGIKRRTGAIEIMYVPLTFHVITKDDGSGGETAENILESIKYMNQHFAEANIQFYSCGPINYIASGNMYDYVDSIASTNLPSTYDVPQTINIIYYNSIYLPGFGYAGGFAYFPGGPLRIYMSKGSGRYTLDHEMGHAWGLPHTFNNSEHPDENYRELVTRGAGANCSTAGDAICDTPADPYVYGKSKGYYSDCIFTDTLFDRNGERYSPMVNNVMSYYNGCNTEVFTTGQMDVIRSYKTSPHRSVWNNTCNELTPPTELAASLDDKFGVILNWKDNATGELGYILEISQGTNDNFKFFNIYPENSNTAYLGTLNSNTTYYFRIKPLAGRASYSNTAQIKTGIVYCYALNKTNCEIKNFIINGLPALAGIKSVSLEGETLLKNKSQCSENGYEFYKQTIAKVYKEINYHLNVEQLSRENGNTSPTFYAWIDLNNDGIFDNSTERWVLKRDEQNFNNYTINLKFNNQVNSGVKRMRIRATYPENSNITACEEVLYGETEDYLIEVLEKPNSFPIQLVASYDNLYKANLSWTNNIFAANTKCVVFVDKGSGFQRLDTILISDLNYSAFVTTNGSYSFLLRNVSDNTLISTIATIEINNINYCIPSYKSECAANNDFSISKVTIYGETLYSRSSECSKNGFEDINDNSTTLYTGMPYTIDVNQRIVGSGYSVKGLTGWIDYNNNGSFEDEGERFVITNSSFGIYSGSTLVPNNAKAGMTKLRIRIHNNYPISSCERATSGETKDYTITIANTPATLPVSLNLSHNQPYTNNLTWTYKDIPAGTKIHIYRSFDGKNLTLIKSLNIESLSYNDIIGANGTYQYLIRKASDNSLLSNNVQTLVNDYQYPYTLTGNLDKNKIRISWNTNTINTNEKALVYRSLSYNTSYFLKMDTVELSKGYYDDIRYNIGDTVFIYNIRTLTGETISNNLKITVDNNYCIPTFKNTTCLSPLNTSVSFFNNNKYQTILYNPYCFNDLFINPSYTSSVTTLNSETEYNFYLYLNENCTDNTPTSNAKNVSIFIDYDQDGTFSINEQIYANPVGSYMCVIFFAYTLPLDVPSGLTRMRYIITEKDHQINDPCGSYEIGTGYDHIININNGLLTQNKNAVSKKQSTLVVYPNPSINGTFSISGEDLVNRLTIYRVTGEIVFDGDPVQLSPLPPGMYIIDIHTEKNSISQKVRFLSK